MRNFPQGQRVDMEVRSLARELVNVRSELHLALQKNKTESFLHSPALLAVLGVAGTLASGIWQLHSNRELEREKLRTSMIQEASRSGNPETTLRNLRFLVASGVLSDENGQIATLQLADAPSFISDKSKPLTMAELTDMFGDPKINTSNDLSFGAFGKPDEAWVAANLVELELPQLKRLQGFPASGKIKFHKKAAPHLVAALKEIEERGLLPKLVSFGGAWIPRTIRGGAYSTHAFGISIDLNVETEWVGEGPQTFDAVKSLQELVPIFKRHGFYWGGDFAQPDASHFQYGIKAQSIKVSQAENEKFNSDRCNVNNGNPCF